MKQIAIALLMVFVSLPMLANAVGISKNSNKKALLFELTGKDDSLVSDTVLYAEIVSAYQKSDELGLKSRLQNLSSRFPKSEYLDNAVYLAGRLAMDNRNYAEAIKQFAKIQKQYANGDKAAAAAFAKGMAYKKMNLPKIAQQVLVGVKKKYPGSPESFRAESEIKIIK